METNSPVKVVVSDKVDVLEVSDFLFVKGVVDLVRGFVVGEMPISTVKLMSVMHETSPLSLALTVR